MEDDFNKIFNSSISSLDNSKKYTDEEFLNITSSKLETILKEIFPGNYKKQIIKKTKNGLNFACPYCHDSLNDDYKKRGWFLLNGKFSGHFKCFNCGKYTSIQKFFHDWKKDIDLGSIDYLNEHTTNLEYNLNNQTSSIDIITNKEEIEKYGVDINVIKNKLGLKEIEKGSEGYRYLVNRCQYNFDNFLYDPIGKYIVILNSFEDKVYGIQIRDITGTKKSKYLTLSLQRMHEKIYQDGIQVPDDIEKLSTIFNIFKVNFYKPILVTEGAFDAFLLPNAIATAGASKAINLDMMLYYVYDSDKTGNSYAIKQLTNGNYVFLWSKLKKDFNLPQRNKWDVNEVYIWLRDNKIKNKVN